MICLKLFDRRENIVGKGENDCYLNLETAKILLPGNGLTKHCQK